jgi:hypothetical protein
MYVQAMSLPLQVLYLFILAVPVASVVWTITHEEIAREFRELCESKCARGRTVFERKFFYLFTCESYFSHYVTVGILIVTRYKLLYPDWRGYLVAALSLVWVANIYMGLFARMRLEVKKERVEIDQKQSRPEQKKV